MDKQVYARCSLSERPPAANDMDNIITWLDPRIPVEYIVGSFIILCVLILLVFLFFNGRKAKRFTLIALCAEYYFMILCSTIICRTEEINRSIELNPIGKYINIWNKVDYPRDLMEMLMNIILFLPIGLLLGGILQRTRWWVALLIGGCLSIIVELLQYAFSKGQCEVSDVIHNTLGCMIGYGVYVLLIKSIKYEKVRNT